MAKKDKSKDEELAEKQAAIAREAGTMPLPEGRKDTTEAEEEAK